MILAMRTTLHHLFKEHTEGRIKSFQTCRKSLTDLPCIFSQKGYWGYTLSAEEQLKNACMPGTSLDTQEAKGIPRIMKKRISLDSS